MKNINLLSLVQAYRALEAQSYAKFLQHYGIDIRSQEVEDLECLTSSLYDLTEEKSIFDGFYVSYKIPQIAKEFDLLRFGSECVINIELKSISTEDKIKKQLIRNRYYLSYIEKNIYNLSFETQTDKLYFLTDDERLETVEISFLEKLLRDQKSEISKDIDGLFNPSDYLVSPFNSTKRFIENKYFLTNQQEDIKNKVISSLNMSKTENYISIIGGAGTGKTLLIYDIVKNLNDSKKKTLIFHCGYLNNGQKELNSLGWEIMPIKQFLNCNISNYDSIFIDEAQRIYPKQLNKIIKEIKQFGGNCIFSYDKAQTLSSSEERRNIDALINGIETITTYKLSDKIRTNKEIATFIKLLFNNTRKLKLLSKGNIELSYFSDIKDAKSYLSSLDSDHWEVLRFTPSQYNVEHHEQYSDSSKKTSHEVIGQEFEGVVVTIDKYFTYDVNGELVYGGGAYYHPAKMLFQNITRARKKLNIVIIDNQELLDRCISILNT